MVIQQKIGSTRIKLFAIFIISLIVAAGAFIGFRSMPSQADSEVINIGTDLVIGRSGTNWSYEASSDGKYNILTITNDVTLTGEGEADKNIRIVGGHRIKFEDMTLDTTASTALTIWDANGILLTGENTINVDNASLTDRMGIHVQCSGLCAQNYIFNIDSTTGGILNINLPSSNTGNYNDGFQLMEASLYIHNSTVNINIGDYTGDSMYGRARGLVFGSGSGRIQSVKVEKSSLNIKTGATKRINFGTNADKVILAEGGYVSSIVGDGSTSNAITTSNILTDPSTARYTWTASENSDGDPLIKGDYPGVAYDAAEGYKYAKLTYRAPNQPVDVSVTSPTNNQYINPNNGFGISGTIIDADDDTWNVGAAIALAENSYVGDWWPCATNTTTRAFSCQYAGLSALEGEKYLHVRVSDLPSNPLYSTSKIFKIPVIVDTKSPAAPKIKYDSPYVDDTWTNTAVKFSITHGTDTNGISKSTYSLSDGINEGVETDWDGKLITIDKDGVYEINVNTYDNAGNKSATTTGTVKIDKTGPKNKEERTGETINPGVNFTDYIDPPTSKLTATDALSGVKEIKYYWATGKVYSSNCDFTNAQTHSGDTIDNISPPSVVGNYSLCFVSYDNLDNKSAVTSLWINIVDIVPPSITQSPSGGSLVSGTTYSAPPTIDLVATDPSTEAGTSGSGVEAIKYSWHDGIVSAGECLLDTEATGATTQTVVPSNLGRHTLCYQAIDKSGNGSDVDIATYTITDLRNEMEDNETEIIVENLGIGFTDDQYLVINKLANDSYQFAREQDTLTIFSIKVCSEFDGECTPIIDWPDKLRIKIPVTEYLKTYEKFALIHIKDTGEQVEHPFKIEDGFMVFETDGLSDWAVLGTMKSQGNTPAPGDGDNTTLLPPNTGTDIHKNILTIICLIIAVCSTALIVLNTKAIRASKK